MLTTLPFLIAALSLTIYWGTVVVKSIRISRKLGKDPNVIPREHLGRWLRIIWCPIIVLWILQLWLMTFHAENKLLQNFYLTTPQLDSFWIFASYLGSILVLIATALTFVCWHRMGLSWRIGIDPNETTELIVSGPYRYVLHPIYGLSMLLAVATLLIAPTLLMFITILIHCCLLYFEARREEHYLILCHGQRYIDYKKTVGRFIPKLCCKN